MRMIPRLARGNLCAFFADGRFAIGMGFGKATASSAARATATVRA